MSHSFSDDAWGKLMPVDTKGQEGLIYECSEPVAIDTPRSITRRMASIIVGGELPVPSSN